jgi:hypothetical protein
MYFIITGIQFWMTSYLIDILHIDPILVITVFSIVSITALMGGVIMGGIFADQYGGYKGKNLVKALKLCFAFGMVSFVFAWIYIQHDLYNSFILDVFIFGAAVVLVQV